MIASNDIRLRASEPEDLELAYELENDTSLWAHGSTTVPLSHFTLKQFLESNSADLFADRQVRLTIERRESDGEWKPVGFADLFNFDPRNNRAEIGLAVLPQFRGQAVGEGAVRCLVEYADVVGLHCIYAVISEENEKASHTFERLGFTASARLCDWLWNGKSYVAACVWQKIIFPCRGRLHESRP